MSIAIPCAAASFFSVLLLGMPSPCSVREFRVSAERLYGALADQQELGKWLGAKVSVPVTGPSGLVGTVRRIHLGPAAFDERIVAARAPEVIDYEIVKPMPLLKHHKGEMRIEALGPDRSRLRWSIRLDLTAGLDVVVLPVVRGVLASGLGRLAKRLGR